MSKLSDRILNVMQLNGEDQFEEMIEEEYEEDEMEEEEEGRGLFSFLQRKKSEEPEEEQEPVAAKTTRVTPPVTETRTVRNTRRSSNIVSIGRGEEVKVVKPQSFNEAQTITDHLKDNKTVVVNLEGIEITTAQRIIDFIGGASYALEGTLQPISNKIFILAPKNISISGDLKDKFAGENFVSPDLGSF
ncbi:MAG: cell division protein SepF [Lachnospiraceae bacterium]|nr:cell division protein SepF [Lachnospiraceae bacterium]